MMSNNREENKSLFWQAFKGTVFLGSFNTLSQVAAITNSFIILYLLSVYEYGLYILVLSLVGLAEASLFENIDQLIATDIQIERVRGNFLKARKLFQEYFLSKFILGALAFLILFFGAQFIADHYGYQSIALFIKLAAFLALIRGLDDSLRINFKIRKKFFQMGSFAFILEFVKLLILLVIVFYFDPGIAKIIAAMILANLASTTWLFYYNRRDFYDWFKDFNINFKDLALWQIIKAHGKWNLFGGVVSKLEKNIKPWLIKLFISTEAVAVYNFGKNLYTHLAGLVPLKKVINQLIPEITKDRERLTRAFIYGSKYFSLVLIAVNLAGLLVLPLFVYFVFPKYLSSLPIFMLFLIAPFIYSGLGNVSETILFSLRQQKTLAYLPVLKLFSVIILNSLFLPVFGVYGMVFEFLITNFISVLIMYLSTVKKLALKWFVFVKMFGYGKIDQMILNNILRRFKKRKERAADDGG